MRVGAKEVSVEEVEVLLNKNLLLSLLVISGFIIILAGFLAYVFSESVWSLLCALVFAVTLGVLINYFLVVKTKLITRVDVNLKLKEKTEEFHSVMKVE